MQKRVRDIWFKHKLLYHSIALSQPPSRDTVSLKLNQEIISGVLIHGVKLLLLRVSFTGNSGF
jgi:hypothetical protein